tara:strand:+ start:1034 stop:1867 length:834 start_codon:yes stop_codon:yes gene_type:complete
MTTLAAADDILVSVPVRIGRRLAVLDIKDGFHVSVTLANGHRTRVAPGSIETVIASNSMVAICFHSPQQVFKLPMRASRSLTFTFAAQDTGAWTTALDRALEFPHAIDVRGVPTIQTVCARSCLQFAKSGEIVQWAANNSCTVVKQVEAVLLQRTKGGMSTYDVHVLPLHSDDVLTVEMLPHKTMDAWENQLGPPRVFDFGPDPIPVTVIKDMFHELRTWSRVCTDLTDTANGADTGDDMVVDCSDSDYAANLENSETESSSASDAITSSESDICED